MSPGAKMGDKVVGTDIHILLVPSPGGPVPTPTPIPFTGTITGGCSADVLIAGAPAAVLGSTATNAPPHLAPPPATFQVPPTNQGTVIKGSGTVLINNKPAARAGDTVQTCNDPAPAPTGSIIAVSTVDIGG
ncbi:PAAR domain-containing protein [Actinokineospora sp. NBRC 105648]|uniref:PAAR domain-containing protein n=1 Tax=Actinokineospora sp. NBRC 105648 TaxID=3032206 RepID=UPI0024A46120|nr:PAAR domain-containing protein [Actinokineospora sp. NBRC 105648]GLZ39449.1 PAAR motif protein [Actinokineospora sp. NBRC 105648]